MLVMKCNMLSSLLPHYATPQARLPLDRSRSRAESLVIYMQHVKHRIASKMTLQGDIKHK